MQDAGLVPGKAVRLMGVHKNTLTLLHDFLSLEQVRPDSKLLKAGFMNCNENRMDLREKRENGNQLGKQMFIRPGTVGH